MIIEQLDQLGLEGCYDSFEVPVHDKKGVLVKTKILITIRVPVHLIDKAAKENDISCALRISDKQYFVKAPYDKEYSNNFTKFDSCEKLETFEEFLVQEINFEYDMATGVIDEHSPLHKR